TLFRSRLPALDGLEAEDREDHRGDPEQEAQEADRDEEPDEREGDVTDQDRDLEVQGRLRLLRDERAAVLVDEPDDERGQEPEDAAEVGPAGPLTGLVVRKRGTGLGGGLVSHGCLQALDRKST